MSMSKKDFIALAKHIAKCEPDCEPFTDRQIAWLARFCKSINPAFKRERWIDYIAGKCGPNGGPVKKVEAA